MFDREKPVTEKISAEFHEEYQVVNTSVSDMLLRYGTGKLDKMPTDTRNQVKDERTVEEMLDEVEPPMSTEELDVLIELQSAADKFKLANDEIELTTKQRTQFDNAVKVLQDHNSSLDAKRDAYAILEKLERAGKLVRD